MKYLPLLKALRGRPVMLEVGDVSRQAVEVVRGFVWDTFFDNALTLVITFREENVLKLGPDNKPAVVDGKQVYEKNIEYYFKWVATEKILTVESDALVKINMPERKLIKLKSEPLYTDNLPGWPVLNNGLSRMIKTRLAELDMCPSELTFEGVLRNEANEPISGEETLAQNAPAVNIGVGGTAVVNSAPAQAAPVGGQ